MEIVGSTSHTHKWQTLLLIFRKGVNPCHSFFQRLGEVIKRELQCDDQRALEITQQRVVKAVSTVSSEALLRLDEAMEVIEDHDQKLIRRQKELIRDAIGNHKLFSAAYRATPLQVRPAATKRARKSDQPTEVPITWNKRIATYADPLDLKSGGPLEEQNGVDTYHLSAASLPAFQTWGGSEPALEGCLKHLWPQYCFANPHLECP